MDAESNSVKNLNYKTENAEEWKRIEYIQLNESARNLYDSYFKLASMSFNWNASLATGCVGILFYSQSQSIQDRTIFFIIAAAISVIALVYNIGAGRAYGAIFRGVHNLHEAMEKLEIEGITYIPGLIRSNFGGGKKPSERPELGQLNIVHILTQIFFSCLVLTWTSLLIYVGTRFW